MEVHATHPYRDDPTIALVAPDGTEGDVSDDGEWRLRAGDVYLKDTGRLDSWTLSL